MLRPPQLEQPRRAGHAAHTRAAVPVQRPTRLLPLVLPRVCLGAQVGPGIQQYIFCSSAGVYKKSDQMPHREEDEVDFKSRHKVGWGSGVGGSVCALAPGGGRLQVGRRGGSGLAAAP